MSYSIDQAAIDLNAAGIPAKVEEKPGWQQGERIWTLVAGDDSYTVLFSSIAIRGTYKQSLSTEWEFSIRTICQVNQIAKQHGFRIITISKDRGWRDELLIRLVFDTYIKVELEGQVRRYNSRSQAVSVFSGVFTEFVKLNTGAYGRRQSHNIPENDLSPLGPALQKLAQIPKPKFDHKTVVLGEPHQFQSVGPHAIADSTQGFSSIRNGSDVYTHSKNVIKGVVILGIISFAEDRSLSDATSPNNEDVWFHAHCSTDDTRGVRAIDFHIATNGDTWYQIVKVGKKFKATPETKRGIYWDLKELNQADQSLLNYAITCYTNKLCGEVKDDSLSKKS